MSAWRGRGPGSDIEEGDEGGQSSDRSHVNDDDDNDSDSSDEDLSQKFPHHALPKHGKSIYVDKAFSETSSHSSRNARQSKTIGKRSSHNHAHNGNSGNDGHNSGADRNRTGANADLNSNQHPGGGYHDKHHNSDRASPHADDDDEDSVENLGSEITGSFSGDEESFNSDSQSATSSLTEGTGFASVRSSGRGNVSVNT